jgi:hypothetical protein
LALLAQAARVSPVPLARAHAHNDYVHPQPLADALAHGFTSVEADIWLVDGELLVAHDLEAARSGRTLAALYLDPLRDLVDRNGGRVFPSGSEFLLWIDIKSEAESTYAALRPILAAYGSMLTRFRPERIDAGAVTVILSGNRPRDTLARQMERYAALDGRLPDLDGSAPPSLIPFISDNWQTHFTWRGGVPFPDEEREKLTAIVRRAHSQQRRVRFWAIPDEGAGWEACLLAGVDLINTDRLDALKTFLLQPRGR